MSKERILIVDDEKEIRDLIDIYLKGEGYETIKSENGEEALEILEKNDVLYLFLEGGEPLLREDFFEILSKSTSKFCTWVSTNGTLIDNTEAKEFKKSKVGTVFVSLHGPSAKVHDNITCTPGSFNSSIKGIESLIRQDVSVMTSFQLSKINVNHIEQYINYVQS